MTQVVKDKVTISVHTGLTDEQPVVVRIEGSGVCIIRGLTIEETTELARGLLVAKHDYLEGRIDEAGWRVVS